MTASAARVAVVGAACRLPGANGLAAFWDVLMQKRCVVSELDEERFGTRHLQHPDRTAPGRSVTFAAGQIDKPFHFDPSYFGISPREAAAMDPQQRVLLEVAVEALENAGIASDSLAGEHVGVYAGASSLDYGTHAQLDVAGIEPQSMTGNTLSIIANRLSYVFDLRGPSYVVDTACSSSLIALNNAVEAIEAGKIDTAIVGGVSLLLHPVPFIGFSRASMLSERGLCRAFDAGADGYVRSEGAVALVLRAEDVARARREPIRARIVGAGINADGRTAGVSLPAMQAQAALLREVYDKAEVAPDDLAFIEAHGTGTRVGDPIEATAIGTELAARRAEPLLVGSSKTNFGHLEPASGLVGVVKAALALERNALPASLHFETPNPDIDFQGLNLSVVADTTALPGRDGLRYAGVNSFGFGGANAHVVVADGEPLAPANDLPAAPLLVSACSEAALKALAAATAARIDGATAPAALANAAAYGRARLAHRAVVRPDGSEHMGAALLALAAGEAHPMVATGEAVAPAARPVFVYSGNGSQWAGMGRDAYQGDPAFRHAFERLDKVFMGLSGWSLVTMLFSAELDTEIERTEIAQPLLFALQAVMTDVLAGKGLTPSLVIGHSVGEVAAAYASGALSLADAIRVIHARSTHQEVTRHLGSMAALLVPAAEAEAAIADYPGLEVAAVNSARSVTISGPVDQLAAFGKRARQKRWALKRLDLDYPFHCALVDPIREPLFAALAPITARPVTVPIISTVTAEAAEGPDLGADYWWQNVRRPVLFEPAIRAALAAGHRLFMEVGPRPVLVGYIKDAARSADLRASVVPTLRQNGPADAPVDTVVHAAIAHGAAVDEAVVFGSRAADPAVLPTYPWQHRHYRDTPTVERLQTNTPREHLLLGSRLKPDMLDWRGSLSVGQAPFLADHKVEDAIVFPAAGFVEMFCAVGRRLFDGPLEVSDLDIIAPLVLDEAGEREVRTRQFAPATFLIDSRPRLSEEGWTPHAKATVRAAPTPPAGGPEAAGADEDALDAAALYAITERFGLHYGPAFRRADAVALTGEDRAAVRLAAAEDHGEPFALDPTLFDACFHALFAFLANHQAPDGATAVLPIRIGRLVLAADAAAPVRADLVVRRPTDGIVEADFTLHDAAGAVVATALGVRFQAVPLGRADETLFAASVLKRIARAGEPASHAIRLDVAPIADGAPEPDEDALLVDAGVQAASLAALRPLFQTPATLREAVDAGRLAQSAVPLAARLLDALQAAGLAEQADDRWQVGEPTLASADVAALLSAEHPERLAEAVFVAALPRVLAAAFATGAPQAPLSDALAAQLLTDAPFARPLYDALSDVAAAELARSTGDALRMVVLGASNPAFVRRLAAVLDPCRHELLVTDRDHGVAERAKLLLERTPGLMVRPLADALGDGHKADVVVIAPRLAAPDLSDIVALAKPRAAVVGAAFAPQLLAETLGALGAPDTWWAGSLEPQHPVGALPMPEEWADVLGRAGLERPAIARIDSATTDGLLFLAHTPATDIAASPTLPTVFADGPAAARVAGALAALADEAPRPVLSLGDRAEVPDGDCLIAVDVPDGADLPGALERIGQTLMRMGGAQRAATLVTFGAHAEAGNAIDPNAVAVVGFGRVAMNEFAHMDVRLIDVAPNLAPSEAAVRLAAELAQPNAEREVALASDHRSAVRHLQDRSVDAQHGPRQVLTLTQRGSIDNLVWQPADEPPLGPHDVRIAVDATGLNFRDVMWTLGLLPHEALQDGFAGPTLGMECAGTLSAVGEAVRDLSVGDTVIAFAPAAFASTVTVRADAVIRRPETLPATAAATIPVAFLTACYALIELGRLEADETVLIHGGAGGVGLAALQIAKWRGARVFATAGTPEKRELLTALGADAVFDSRTLAFAQGVLDATGGAGVDLVLNSLAGEAMERSLATLKPFGRFLELGKRDFYEGTKLGLRPFRRNLSYFGIDADQLMAHRPALAKRVLTEVMDRFADGTFTALPHRRFAAAGVRDAFRLMQHAGHVGKIVIDAPAVPTEAPAQAPAARIDAGKAYLLVGGTSGFGFATARWLADEGARHLVLASRSGVTDPAVAEAVAALRADGVSVETPTLDVTDHAAVAALVADVCGARPLGGVFHMAMVLDDALIASLDADRHARVLGPKLQGALALEAALGDTPLDLFVLYSSITVALGNPGQANYVAANAALEGIARRRRARGLPALAVQWGAIADVGVLARDSATSALLAQKLGRHALSAHSALAGLARLMQAGAMTTGPAVRLIGRVDWAAARKDLVLARSPAVMDLTDADDASGDDAGAIDLAERLKGLTEAEAVTEVGNLLAGEISRILKLPVSEVDVHKPLTALGMDSLMGVELRMAAEQRLGIDIPLMSLASGATLNDLAKKVVQRGVGAAAPATEIEDLVTQHIGEAAAEAELPIADYEASFRQRTASVKSIT